MALHTLAPTSRLAVPVGSLGRGDLLGSLLLLGFGSAVSERILVALGTGWFNAVANTFFVSAIVWGALWLAVSLSFEARETQPVRRIDWAVAAVAAFAFLSPVSLANWVGLTALAVYTVVTADRRSPLQRGALIFLAITVPMFWSPRVANLFSEWVLAADAELVSWILGTQRVGNTVPYHNAAGFLYIAPGCSSVANLSQAMLCWAAFAQLSNRPATLRDLGWLLAACIGVVTINVTRISLIGFFPDWYEFLHESPTGTMIAGYSTLFTIVGLCVLWKKRELFPAR